MTHDNLPSLIFFYNILGVLCRKDLTQQAWDCLPLESLVLSGEQFPYSNVKLNRSDKNGLLCLKCCTNNVVYAEHALSSGITEFWYVLGRSAHVTSPQLKPPNFLGMSVIDKTFHVLSLLVAGGIKPNLGDFPGGDSWKLTPGCIHLCSMNLLFCVLLLEQSYEYECLLRPVILPRESSNLWVRSWGPWRRYWFKVIFVHCMTVSFFILHLLYFYNNLLK